MFHVWNGSMAHTHTQQQQFPSNISQMVLIKTTSAIFLCFPHVLRLNRKCFNLCSQHAAYLLYTRPSHVGCDLSSRNFTLNAYDFSISARFHVRCARWIHIIFDFILKDCGDFPSCWFDLIWMWARATQSSIKWRTILHDTCLLLLLLLFKLNPHLMRFNLSIYMHWTVRTHRTYGGDVRCACTRTCIAFEQNKSFPSIWIAGVQSFVWIIRLTNIKCWYARQILMCRNYTVICLEYIFEAKLCTPSVCVSVCAV